MIVLLFTFTISHHADCRWGVKCRLQTVEFSTKSCHDFHHWELTVNRLTKALFRLTWVVFMQCSNWSADYFDSLLLISNSNISLDNITQFIVCIREITHKRSVVCHLHFTTGLQSAFHSQSAFYLQCKVCSPQSAVCSLSFTMTAWFPISKPRGHQVCKLSIQLCLESQHFY